MSSAPAPPSFAPTDAFAPLTTPRLALRIVTLGDVDALHAYQSRADVCRYLPYGPRGHGELTGLVAASAQRTRLRQEGDAVQIAVVRRADERVVGELFFAIRSVTAATAEIGWVLAPDESGRGYATEAAQTLLDFAFGTLRLHRVFARLDVRNTPSARVCERLGMRHEAHHVADVWSDGAWVDTSIYALLADDVQRNPTASGRGSSGLAGSAPAGSSSL